MLAFRKILFLFSTALFLMFSMPGMSGMMAMDEYGNMQGCPYMNGAVVCKMNPLEHVAAWQNMFTALPATMNLVAALVYALLAVAFIRITWTVPTVEPASLYAQRFKYRPHIAAHVLQEAFSRGILNPKTF